MVKEIVTVAAALLGGRLSEEEEALLTRLGQLALEGWQMRLRPEIEPAACGDALVFASALTALDAFVAGQALGGAPSSFRAGDVSLSFGGEASRNGAQAARIMAPFVSDQGFWFQGVRG